MNTFSRQKRLKMEGKILPAFTQRHEYVKCRTPLPWHDEEKREREKGKDLLIQGQAESSGCMRRVCPQRDTEHERLRDRYILQDTEERNPCWFHSSKITDVEQ